MRAPRVPPWRAPTLGDALGVAVVVVGFAIGARPLRDNSFLTHLATGRLILDGGGVPTVDPYSFTAAGHDWTVQSWLVSVAIAGVEQLWGPVGIRLLFGVVAAVLTALIWRLSAPVESVVARLALVVVALTVGAGMWTERPYMVALVLFALVLALIEAGARPWWLVALFALWVNVHGSFPVGLGLVGLWSLGRALDRRRVVRGDWSAVGASVLGCALGAVSPWGPRLLAFPFASLLSGGSLREVVEWRSPTFDDVPQLAFLALVGLTVLTAGSLAWSRRLPAAVFALAGLLALRNVAFASVVAVWAAAPALPEVGTLRSATAGRPARLGLALASLAAMLVVPVRLGEGSLALHSYPAAPFALLAERGLLPGARVVVPEARRQLPRGALRRAGPGVLRRPLRHVPGPGGRGLLRARGRRRPLGADPGQLPGRPGRVGARPPSRLGAGRLSCVAAALRR